MMSGPAENPSPALPAAGRFSAVAWVLVGLVFLATLARVWCTPNEALDHLMEPDGSEYIAAAYRWVHGQGFNISVAGTVYPTRYVPGFSLLLAPVYALAGHELGSGIFLVTALALAGSVAAFQIGRELTGSVFAGTLAALVMWFEPTTVAVSRSIQSDGPAMSIVLLATWAALRGFRTQRIQPLVAAGCLLGLATAIRPLLIVLAPLAFVLLFLPKTNRGSPRRFLSILLSLGLPTLLVFIATGLYQLKTFGSFSRGGYAFWVPLPYEFPDLVFAWRYYTFNLQHTQRPLMILSAFAACGIGLLAWTTGRRSVLIALAMLLGPLLISLLHTFYLWPSPRFHVLYFAMSLVVFGAGVGTLVDLKRPHVAWAMLLACGCGVFFLAKPREGMQPIFSAPMMREIVAVTPENALIVTDVTAPYFDIAGRGRRQFIATRREEYAGKLIAPKPLNFPQGRPPEVTWPPRDPQEHRNPLLRLAGAVDAVPTVATEDLSPVDAALRAGTPVFLDVAFTPKELQDAFGARYTCEKVSPGLVAVRPAPGSPSLTPSTLPTSFLSPRR